VYRLHCTFFIFQKAGLESEFEEDNITVFASSNSAWNKLPKGVMDYLKSDEVLSSFLFLIRFCPLSMNVIAKDVSENLSPSKFMF
jgi:hypothetical protein